MQGMAEWYPQEFKLSAVHTTSTWGLRDARAGKKRQYAIQGTAGWWLTGSMMREDSDHLSDHSSMAVKPAHDLTTPDKCDICLLANGGGGEGGWNL